VPALALRRNLVNAPASQDDAALAARGDRRAFERLYRANVDRVFSLCARMVADRTRAEELTQDVFVRAWEKLGQFRGESAFSTWIHRLAVNLVLNERKSERRHDARIDAGIDDVDALPHRRTRGVDGDASPGLSMDLEQAIAGLPPGARKVFVLHDVEGYTHEEIAGMLGVTSGGCKAQLHRARMLLREVLSA
jgi:RNA polymerase sigma-70 factor (ECF subfamily)